MRSSKKAWCRAIIFTLVFITANYALTFVLVPKGDISRMVIREMYSETKNFDIVFAGASLSQRDIDPYIIDKELNCNSFDYSFSQQQFSGTYYSLKELFKYHKPKMIVVSMDPSNFTTPEEQPISYYSVALYMKSFLNKVQFYFGSAKEGSALDKLFVWQGYHVKTINEAISNVYEKLEPSYINYPEPGQVEAFSTRKDGYIGKGALKFDYNDPKNLINYDTLGKFNHNTVYNISDIQKNNVEYLRKISELCKKNNCELILLTTPFTKYEVLRVKNYFEFDDEVAKIAKKLGIVYYNYNLIKPQFFNPQDDYFIDYIHFNSKGKEAFSESLANFLKLRDEGKDMSEYFCKTEEYYASVNYVTNTWFTYTKNDNSITLVGDSFHGSNVVPEYQFVLTDLESGENHIIRDYDTNPSFVFDSKSYKKYKVRVNARAAGCTSDELTRHYEEDIVK